MSNLRYTPKKEYWSEHGKIFLKVFTGLFILFAWIFESTAFGAAFWAGLISVFISGSAIYLTRENLLPDQEILKRIMGGEWTRCR